MKKEADSSKSLLPSWEVLEDRPIGFFRFTIFLCAIMFTRNLLEAFSGTGFTEQAGSYIIHYPLAYIAPLLALSSILAIFSRVPVIRVTRLMLYVWLLTLLPPLVDILITKGIEGEGAQIGYLSVAEGEYWSTFLNFFNPKAALQGTTIGIRIEAFLACILSFVYVFVKSRSILRSLIAPFVVFFVSYFFFTFPHVYLALVKAGNPTVNNFPDLFLSKGQLIRSDTARLSLIMAQADIILVALVFMFWYGLHSGLDGLRRIFRLITKPGTGFAVIMVLAGFTIGWRVILPHETLGSILSHHSDFMSLLSVLLAGIGASVGLSCIEKEEERGSGETDFPRHEVMFVSFVFAAVNTLVIGFPVFCFLVLYVSAGLFRIARPFELKKYPALSAISSTLGSIALVSMSYSLFVGSRTPAFFPKGILTILFISLTSGFLAIELSRKREARSCQRSTMLTSDLLMRTALFLIAYLIPALYFGGTGLLILSLGAAILSAFSPLIPPRRETAGLFLLLYLASALFLHFLKLREYGNPTWGTPLQIRHAELASMFKSEGRDDLAGTEYKEAVRLGSPDPTVYFGLGFEYTKEGKELQAADMFRRATELDSTYGEAYFNLGLSNAGLDMGREAVRNFRKAITFLDDKKEARLASAGILAGKGYLQEALSILLEDLDESAEEQLVIFDILQRSLEVSADSSADSLVFDRSTEAGALLDRFASALRGGAGSGWKQIHEDLSAIQRDFPHIPVIIYYQAWAAQMQGNMKAAVTGYLRILERIPDFYEARMNLGAAYVSLGKLSEAKEIFTKLLSMKPDDPSALVNLSNAYAREGKFDESLELLTRASNIDPENYLVKFNLGIVYEGLSRYDDAITQYQTLLLKGAESPELLTRLAGCYLRKGDPVNARGSLERALRLNPGYQPAREALKSLDRK